MGKSRAFTLIELLVVIAIIALLLSIITPALNKAKKQAKFIVCKTNLKAYGQAGSIYLSEYNESFPDSYTWLHDDGAKSRIDPCAWHDAKYLADGQLWPYLEHEDVHMCPLFYQLSLRLGIDHQGHNQPIPIDPQYSYSMNAYLGYGFFGVVEKVTEIRNSATVLFFSEENVWAIPGLSRFPLNNNNLIIQQTNSWNNIATYHRAKGNDLNSGVANVVFVDGHVDSALAQESYRIVRPD